MQVKIQQQNNKNNRVALSLRNYEHRIYKRAITRKYLSIDEETSSSYLLDLWHKATDAQGLPFVVLMKNPSSGLATVFHDNQIIYRGELIEARKEVDLLLG